MQTTNNDIRELAADEQRDVCGGETHFVPYLPVEPLWPYPSEPMIDPLFPLFQTP